MSPTLIFALLGGLVVLAFVANRLFVHTRVPDILVLILAGVLLGPVFGLVNAGQFQEVTNALGTLALILILFEGGLDLEIRSTLRQVPGGVLLSFLAYIFSLILTAEVAHRGMGLGWPASLAAGAVLGCTSSSVTLPVMQQIEASSHARITLMIESSMSDCFAVLTVGILIGIGAHSGPLATQLVYRLSMMVFISLLIAAAAGLLWSWVLPKLSERRFWNAMTLSVVLLLYAAAEHIGASGLITVFCFGIILANIRRIDATVLGDSLGFRLVDDARHSQMLTFYSELAFLVRSFFFVLLGIVIEFHNVLHYLLPALGVLGALILARVLAIKASSWAWKDFQAKERELILWIMPRGLITIVLALQVIHAKGSEFAFISALAFSIIIITNVMLVIGSIRAVQISPEARSPEDIAAEAAQVEMKK